jgi:2-enoate reductase
MGHIGEGPVCCAVNPVCGREKIYGIEPALIEKKILIVGGGLAGMEVARVSAERGYKVMLYEKSGKMGGHLIAGGVPSFKINDRKLLAWYVRQLELLGVKIKLNTAMDKSAIVKKRADVVVIATGSKPITMDFGKDKEIITASEALLGKKRVGQKVVIIGGGLVGCETGLWLAQQGREVTIVEMMDDICGGPHAMPFMNYDMLKDELAFHKVKIFKSSKVTAVSKKDVAVIAPEGKIKIEADTVIIAVGYKPDDSLYQSVKDTLKVPVYNIGDSRNVHNIMYAIWDAYEIAREM